MHFSEESRFFLDNIKLIEKAFLIAADAHLYYLRSLLTLKIVTPKLFRYIMRRLHNLRTVPEKVRFVVDELIPEILFRKNISPRRIMLVEIVSQCLEYYNEKDSELKSILYAW